MQRVLTIAFLLAAIISVPAAAQDNPELDAAITRYLEVTKTRENTALMIENMAAQMPEEQQALFRRVMAKVMNVDEVLELSRGIMRKHFTLEEVNALADFYSSPAGVSAMNKLQLVINESMPYIQSAIQKSIEELNRLAREEPDLFKSTSEDPKASETSKD
jgi:uncharacterized protein